MNRRLEVSELDELAGRALARAESALLDDDPATAKLWLDHLICLRALERTRKVEIIARMELALLDGGGP